MASAMARYPASLRCRWSPESKAGSSRSASSGEPTARSKSMTASYSPEVRIHALTAARLASLLAARGGERRGPCGRHGGPDDPQPCGAGLLDHAAETCDDLVGGDVGVRREDGERRRLGHLADTDVVDAQQDDDRPHARPAEDIAPEPGQRAVTEPGRVDRHPVTADALVQHGAGTTGRDQALGERVREAAVGVRGAAHTLGEGVAEQHDARGSRRAAAARHVQPAQVVPGLRGVGERRAAGVGAVVTVGAVAGRMRLGVECRGAGRPGRVERDRHLVQRRRPERRQVAGDFRTGRDRERPLPVDGEVLKRLLPDVGATRTGGDGGPGDRERAGPVDVRQPDPDRVAADGDPDHLTDRLAREALLGPVRGEARTRTLHRGGPGGGPGGRGRGRSKAGVGRIGVGGLHDRHRRSPQASRST